MKIFWLAATFGLVFLALHDLAMVTHPTTSLKLQSDIMVRGLLVSVSAAMCLHGYLNYPGEKNES